MIEQSPKILMVEGIDDKKVIEKLLTRRKLSFNDVVIHNCEGIIKLLNLLPVIIHAGSYEVIGIIVDADENVKNRWESVRNILLKAGYKNIPADSQIKGLTLKDKNEELPEIGVWIMPDNRFKGAIEDFISFLIRDNDKLYPVAAAKVDKLISQKMNLFSISQKSKAIIHTWLAWQERPGKQIGSAVTYRLLKDQRYLLDDAKASPFIDWLKRLFK
ncbi:Uncharacterized protein dnl_51870 [Desulfonema limicola]|uniref:Uncharacterized protein n=1 Tax=Desulfonema limicola TaxID=45656 RepID=A0A975BCK9_9BACT|nr:DUF3226 domain-containing protein [Desulfonema limicola]QTA82803.1 Uncharacterized protein dnl_51870 [Desulfonema limicola]